MSEYVYLTCVKEKSKLRVRIITDGYFKNANCQFPRDLRQEGRIYKVHCRNITLITTRGKYYYSVKKNHIELETEKPPEDLTNFSVYEDDTQEECLICYANKKSMIFFPCGHYYTCGECSMKVEKCPICRERITNMIKKEDME